MSEAKFIRTYQLGVAGGIGGLVAGGIVALVLLILHSNGPVKGLGGGPSSPIKVRGGAMTIRSGDPSGWKKIKGTSSFCSDNADPTYLTFNEVKLISGTQPDLTKITYDWTILIVGRAFPGDTPSSNGVMLASQSQNCAGTDKTLKSVTLSLVNDATFYSNDTPVNDVKVGNGNVFAKRFQDTSDNCIGPDGFDGDGNRAAYDEDACERISQFTLTIMAPTNLASIYRCPNGECAIVVGSAN